ncbi:MAG: LysR family transcriptional regulator [Proteobacteria bacterium]|nr:LysR family transcriptional regulator [Pseudomonadota bacterium]MBU4470693.1 LysR family transcriptional regulator [Pseudomonadota bacterium]MCG2751211.1 LysR family transcriptional regulator [Desulfobacteraceae bacterium]
MDLWQLHIFCKVIENKSFSKAGLAAHLSQPTVSSHIKDLEDHFECVLIDRLGKEVNPTRAGKLLYRYAKKLLALRDEAEMAMSEFQGMLKGKLLIGGSTIPSAYILPPIIGRFSKEFPDVTMSLVVGDSEYIAGEILSGNLEMGILGASFDNKKIQQEKFIQDEMKLIVSASHPLANRKQVSLEQLFQLPFIIRESGSGTLRSMKNSFEKAGHSLDELKIIAEMGSTMAVIQGVKENMGVSIVSTLSIQEDLKYGTLKALSIDGMNLNRYFYLSWHKHRSMSPLGTAFKAFLDNHNK